MNACGTIYARSSRIRIKSHKPFNALREEQGRLRNSKPGERIFVERRKASTISSNG
jgi:hypothetical protein